MAHGTRFVAFQRISRPSHSPDRRVAPRSPYVRTAFIPNNGIAACRVQRLTVNPSA